MAGLGRTIPALPVSDAAAAVAYFRDRLGFTPIHVEDGFAVFQRDKARLHLWQAADGSWSDRMDLGERPICSGAESFLAGTASCRIETEDVDRLHVKLMAAEVLHPVSRAAITARARLLGVEHDLLLGQQLRPVDLKEHRGGRPTEAKRPRVQTRGEQHHLPVARIHRAGQEVGVPAGANRQVRIAATLDVERAASSKPAWTASTRASGSSNNRSYRSLSWARAAAVHRAVCAIGSTAGPDRRHETPSPTVYHAPPPRALRPPSPILLR